MQIKNLLVSFIVAFIGGYLASLLHIPLPWTLGSLFTVIIWNLSAQNYTVLKQGRRIGQFIIGVSLGLYFTKNIVQLITQEWFLLSLGVVLCLLMSLIVIFINAKQHPSFATVYFTYLPGGASEMVNMSKKFGADPAFVAIGHTIRVVVLVFSVPLLATIWSDAEHVTNAVQSENNIVFLGILASLVCSFVGVFTWKKLKQANPWMISALFGTALPTILWSYP